MVTVPEQDSELLRYSDAGVSAPITAAPNTTLDSSVHSEQGMVPDQAVKKNRKWIVMIALLAVVASVALIVAFTQNSSKQGKRVSAAQPPITDAPSLSPTEGPSASPTELTASPSAYPSSAPSSAPSTPEPTMSPTQQPTGSPSKPPTSQPSATPTVQPTSTPTRPPTLERTSLGPSESQSPSTTPSTSMRPSANAATFVPGNLTVQTVGLLLSQGLGARIIASTGEPVEFHDGSTSNVPFHGRPDFGATFPDTRPGNKGGWVYVSNSEMPKDGEGGVGSIAFDKDGNVIDYRMVLEGTTMNCGGGRTPWNTWVSCEEVEFFGEIYQVDPFGEISAEKATIGSQLGRWESFAYDNRDTSDPRFFATEDHNKGTVRRFRPDPSKIDWDSPWNMLHANGTIDYMIVQPNKELSGGTFEWTDDIEAARNNARSYYPQSEGIDIYNGTMYVVCKGIKQMFVFDLDKGIYYNQSTITGLFDGGPDQMQRILDDDPGDLLYFTEEGGVDAGIHARDEDGRFYTIMESPIYQDETTGLAFSPDGKHMYVAYQVNGLLFDIWREDGYSFGARTLNVKYHETGLSGL